MPYFARLGVSHLYASPIATARPGSQHGYDVIDATRVNPELGGEEGLRALSSALAAAGMGLILDIVPNHMAADTANAWWADVLRHGRASRFARWFDIDWDARRQGPAADPRPSARRGAGRGRARARRRCVPLLLASPARVDGGLEQPALAAGLVAQRRRSHQLAALLRHQRAGLPAHGGARGLRGRPCPAAAPAPGGHRRRPAHRPCRRPDRSRRLLPGPARAAQARRLARGREDPARAARPCRPTGAATAPPATTSWTRSAPCSTTRPASACWPRPGRR